MNTFFAWLNSAGPVFCRHAFWMLIQTGVLFSILWLLDRLLRRSVKASFRYTLWLLILIKLLLPVSLALPSGVGYWVHLPEQAPIAADSLPTFGSEDTGNAAAAIPTQPQNLPKSIDASQETQHSGPSQQVSSLPGQSPVQLTLWGALFGLWILGSVILAGAVVYQVFYLRRLLSHSCPVPQTVRDLLAAGQAHVGLNRKIDIKQSDEVPSPAVCGLWRPTILIPASLIEQLDPEKLRAVLLHELGHIQRHDLWVNMIQTILQLFYFYNPFVRLANHWIRRAREQANDEHVLLHLEGRRQDYSATLLEIAAGALARPALAMRMIGVAEPKTQLHERITLIMKKPLPKNTKTGLLEIAALIVAALLLLPMAAGPRALAEDNKIQGMSLTQGQAIEQENKIIANMIESYNDKDLDGFLSAYSEDIIFLHDQAAITMGKLGLRMSFTPEFSSSSEVLDHDYTYHEMWLCGNYLITAVQDKVAFQLGSMSQMLTLLRNYITVYQVQPDGALKINIQGLNMADPRSLFELPDTPAATVFHEVESNSMTTESLHETLEYVKKLDIDFHNCFNRQEQQKAVTYYAPDATLMGIGKNPIHGPEAIETFIIEGSRGMQHVSNNQVILHAEGNDQMVIIVNQFGWVFKVLETGETTMIPGKGIHVWQKQSDGSWKILLDIHNASIPLDDA